MSVKILHCVAFQRFVNVIHPHHPMKKYLRSESMILEREESKKNTLKKRYFFTVCEERNGILVSCLKHKYRSPEKTAKPKSNHTQTNPHSWRFLWTDSAYTHAA